MSLYQVINIDFKMLRKTVKPPKVCDITPGVAVQVLNFVGLEHAEMEHALRAGNTWDVTTVGTVLTAVANERP